MFVWLERQVNSNISILISDQRRSVDHTCGGGVTQFFKIKNSGDLVKLSVNVHF